MPPHVTANKNRRTGFVSGYNVDNSVVRKNGGIKKEYMHFLFNQGRFKLYEIESQDVGVEGVNKNVYTLGSVLLFEEIESSCTLGNEVAWADNPDDASLLAKDITEGKKDILIYVKADHAQKAVKDIEEQKKKAKTKKSKQGSSGKPKAPTANAVSDKKSAAAG